MIKRTLFLFALAALFLAGLNLRLTGIAAPGLHPDEPTIGRWIASFSEHGELRDRLYAGGFFRLAAPVRAAARGWTRLSAGRAGQTGAADRLAVPWDDIQFARRLNVALGMLTGLCVLLLAWQITGSRLAALAAAAFCLLNAVHVEHCHYAETDAAMLFVLSLTLLFWGRAIISGQALPLLAGAFAAGFAAGTKFPLIILLLPALIVPFTSRSGDRGRRTLRRTWALAGLSLLLFVLAFAWTNPGILHPASFMAGLAKQSRGLQDEMIITLGAAGQSRILQIGWRLRMLQKHALDAGILPLALSAAGLLAVLTVPRYRKAWPLLLLTPLLLLALNVLVSPFIRKQEFMAFLPFLAILASLPLALPWPAFKSGAWALKGTLAFVTLAALLLACLDASRVAGLFGWKDPRLMARAWNALHAPDDRRVAVENAASAAADGSFSAYLPLRHVADLKEGITLLNRTPVDYVIRDEFAKGRGMADPFTGAYRPRNEPLWTNFQARATLLKRWSPVLSDRANASYAGHGAALYAWDAPAADLDLDIPLDEPLLISEAGRETGFAGNETVGGGVAVRLTGQPREVAFGGPDPVFACRVTLIADETDAKVKLTAWGRTITCRLEAHSVQEVELVKPCWRLDSDPYVKLSAVATRGTCLMRLGRSPLNGYTPSKSARDAWEQVLSQSNRVIAVRGIPEPIYNDFARMRDPALRDRNATLESDRIRKRDSGALRSLKEGQLKLLGRDPAKTCLSVAPYATPFRLARGHYRLALTVCPLPFELTEEANPADADRFELTDGRGRTLFEGRWSELDRSVDTRLQLSLLSESGGELSIYLVTPVPRTLSIRGAELTWTLRDRLEAFTE